MLKVRSSYTLRILFGLLHSLIFTSVIGLIFILKMKPAEAWIKKEDLWG